MPATTTHEFEAHGYRCRVYVLTFGCEVNVFVPSTHPLAQTYAARTYRSLYLGKHQASVWLNALEGTVYFAYEFQRPRELYDPVAAILIATEMAEELRRAETA